MKHKLNKNIFNRFSIVIFFVLVLVLIVIYYFSYLTSKNKSKYSISHFQVNTIPKKIHQIWIGSNPDHLPEYKKKYMASYKNILPSWEYKLWTDNDLTLANFPITYKYIEKIKNDHNDKGANTKIADLMRYEIIYNHGGFYFDTNIELLRDLTALCFPDSIDNSIVNYDIIICCEDDTVNKEGKYLSNGFLAAKANNKYLSRILNSDILDKLPLTTSANNATGPALFAKCFNQSDYTDSKVKLLDTKFIYPVHWSQGKNDKCINSNITESNISDIDIINYKNNKYKLIYPCDKYPESYAIDHFLFGGGWII